MSTPIKTNTLFYGDNLSILRQHIADASIDLVYLDPPFKPGTQFLKPEVISGCLLSQETCPMSKGSICAPLANAQLHSLETTAHRYSHGPS